MGWHQQAGFPILSVITYLPLVGVLLIAAVRQGPAAVLQGRLTGGHLAAFVLSTVMLLRFHTHLPGMQFTENFMWIRRFNIHYSFGVDGIAALLIFLTTLLGFIVIIASWNYVKDRERGFFVSLLLLQVGMTGVFCATDIFLFYVFWEAMLIPMYFIIGIWGGPPRSTRPSSSFFHDGGRAAHAGRHHRARYSARSPIRAVGLTFNIQRASHLVLPLRPADPGFSSPSSWRSPSRCRCSRCIPGCPTPTSRRPTAGSVILAGVLLKMGGYGFMRFALPLFPDAACARPGPVHDPGAVDRASSTAPWWRWCRRTSRSSWPTRA